MRLIGASGTRKLYRGRPRHHRPMRCQRHSLTRVEALADVVASSGFGVAFAGASGAMTGAACGFRGEATDSTLAISSSSVRIAF